MARQSKQKVVDFEAKAAEARDKRVNSCVGEVNAVLEKHRCQFLIVVQIGDQSKPLDQVLGLPAQMMVVSK